MECFSEGQEPVRNGVDNGTILRWNSISYIVNSKTEGKLHILKRISGSARSGRLLAVMGSSGAGKSCLLDILSSRIVGSSVEGAIRLVNAGSSDSINKNMKKTASFSYVPQNTILLNTATVRETFESAALLRLGPISSKELSSRVEATLNDLKLKGKEDSLVGGAEVRGLSGGEMRRVSIGQEICSNDAPVLLLDEPTTGLDSKTAEQVMLNVVELARNKGTIVVATIHQPNSSITSLFDDLMLLSHGECCYCGPFNQAVERFAAAGFVCPLYSNPTDYFLSVIDDPESAAIMISRQKEAWQVLEEAEAGSVDVSSDIVASIELTDNAEAQTSFIHQTKILAIRHARQWIRDPAMFSSELLQYIFIALFLGGMYYDISLELAEGVFNRTSAMFFILSVLVFTPPFTAITTFAQERLLFQKERKDKFYCTSSWLMAKSIITFPIEGALCLVFSSIVYFMIGFQRSAGKFFIFLGILMLFQLIGESAGLLFAIANKSPTYAIVWLSLILIVALSLAGFLTYSMPIYYIWIENSNVLRFALLALLINEFDGLTFKSTDSFTGATIYVKGLDALPTGLKPDLSLNEYIGILIGFLVGTRLLVYFWLKFMD